MKTLKTRLQKEVKKAYLVSGDDFYLFEKALVMIRSALKINFGDLNVSYFDDDNFSALKVVEACDMLPVGDENRLVVIKNVQKVNENDKKIIEKYLESPNISSCLVILDFYGKFESIKKNIDFVDAKRMERTMVSRIVFSDLEKRGKQISLRLIGRTRFARLDTLGEQYTEDSLRAILKGQKSHTPHSRRAPSVQLDRIQLMIDIAA